VIILPFLPFSPHSDNLHSLQSPWYFQPTIVLHSSLPTLSHSCHSSNPNPTPDLILTPLTPLPLSLTCDSWHRLGPMASVCILCFPTFVLLPTCYQTHSHSVDLPPLMPPHCSSCSTATVFLHIASTSLPVCSSTSTLPPASTSTLLPLCYATHTQPTTPLPPAVW